MGDGSRCRYNSVSTQLLFETNTNNSSPILPEEVIVEILLRVPVKSLLQLKCVCKLWKTLISDPQFAKSHLLRLNSTTAYPHLISSYRFGIISYNVESLLEDHLNPIEPDFYPMSQDYSILGSCNGLLCLLEHNRQNVVNVILWNPFLNLKSKPSPTLVSPYSQNVVRAYYGFGYDQVNLKYKVLITFFNVVDGFIDIVTGIYSSGQNSWRMIQNFPTGVYGSFPFDKCSGKCVSGTLNWVVKKEYFNSKREIIISFDLEKETYGEVLLPQSDNINNVTLDVLSNCLCLFFDLEKTQFVVWLMKEYGVADSWTKLMIIPHFILTHMPPIFGDPFHSYPVYKFLTTHGVVRQCNLTMMPSFVDPLFISENGIVLVKTISSRLFLYHARNGNSYSHKLARYNTFLDLQIYHESLVLPQW